VGRLLLGRHTSSGAHQDRVPAGPRRLWARAVTLAGAAALASLVLPSGSGFAAAAHPNPSLQSLLARARVLSNQINSLNEQANGLRIQLQQARAEVKVARHTYTQDLARLEGGRVVVGQLAAQTYMNGGMDSSMELFTSSSPQTLIDRAAIMQELQRENGDRVSQIAAAVAAAQRAQETAKQQSQRALQLSKQIGAKRRQAQSKIRLLNSAVFAKAMDVFRQTGQYPNVNLPTANTIGGQALRAALTRRGDPYVWGAAGPGAFDCSGLVLWAYAQIGISLPHYTGEQWNMGVHVARDDLQPGDLVFFYPDISHVGLYLGNGLMVDAPDFGEVVQVEPVMWDVYVGAVRIVG
jgi:cell wall-associated NlpC family hydrolase